MKYVLALFLILLTTSCMDEGGRALDCSIAGYVDLDATWEIVYYSDTLVTWSEQGNTEKRESQGNGGFLIDQCGSSAVVASVMGGKADAHGISLYSDRTEVNFSGFQYTVTAEGYIDSEAGWIKIKTDYGWVVYDTTFTLLMLNRRFD